ncbi:MAG: NAD(P)/FAD-dependent oxidoreductase [Nanoarchaeota archaeon]
MNIKNEYDVVVVGGGPAGSGAAEAIAKTGLSVLMIEKRAEIGSPKRCGEGLSKSAADRMGIEPDPSWICQTIKGATIYAPDGRYVRADFDDIEGWVIERKIFDKFLARKAAEAGAIVMAKTEALSLLKNGDKIVGVKIQHQNEEMNVKAKIVIAADGVESKLAREAGINTTLKHEDVASCAQFEMANVDVDQYRLELYLGNEKIAPAGYAWIFPKGGKNANVGIGVRKPWASKKAIEYLKDFINSREGLKKGSIIEFNAGGVPVGAIMKDMVLDNFMVAGDAAHQVNPIHGGGISESFVGGRIAGEVASEAIKSGDISKEALSKYNELWWNERGEKLQKIEKLRKVVESMKDDDFNWLVDYLSGDDLIALSKAKKFKLLSDIMIKRPSMILLARKLL